MTEITDKIIEIKEKLGNEVCILGHHYQADDVARHCDIMGDSLELAQKIKTVEAKNIVFCGVYFMGETAALLAADGQKIFLPEPSADCMMALMASARLCRSVLAELCKNGRKVIPLAYVNTMLELKDAAGEYGGAVCTSANAPKMLEWALKQGDSVLFLPDRNLGGNTAKKLGIPLSEQYTIRLNGKGLLPDQEEKLSSRLLLWPGSCAIHARLSVRDVENAKKEGSIVLSHPECKPELAEKCDGCGSTSYLIKETAKIAEMQPGANVVIGTETNLVERLAKRFAKKISIRPLGKSVCPHMAKVTEKKLFYTLDKIAKGKAEPVKIESKMSVNARKTITRMLEICA